ncbi:MAG: type II toxin-antitoxin system VapC family toxin [Dehalococcoidia bacterium]
MPDASMIASLLVPGQRDDAVEEMLLTSGTELVAPEILRQEIHHAILKTMRRQGWVEVEVRTAVATFRSLPINYSYDPSWVDRAFELARELRTGLFDAIYLVASLDLDAELWTRAQRFAAAVAAAYPGRVRVA